MTMNLREQNSMTKLELGVVLSLLASAGSIVFSAGFVWSTLQEHGRDISQLKTNDSSNVDRLARIETKLDVILSDRK